MFSSAQRWAAAFACVLHISCSAMDVAELEEHACNGKASAYSYASFGQAFLGRYCNSCHNETPDETQASSYTGIGLQHSGSTHVTGYSFGSLVEVRKHRARIYARAAGINRSMPPGPNDPSDVERRALADWLGCSSEF